jgi:hypothetical protein
MVGLYDQRDDSEKTRDALTASMKTKIKELIGKCEHCNKAKPINLLEVHHISEVAKANGNSDKNTPGNLIVLCRDHHKLAHDGEITKTALKAKVAKRSEKKKTDLRNILRDRIKIDNSGSITPLYKPPKVKPPKVMFPKFKPPKLF